MTYFSQRNKISTLNSTESPLVSGGSFIGTAEDVSNYESVVVASKSDQDGTLYIDFSPDATNWDSTLTFSVQASVNEVHRITVTRKYFRVRYINGASAQSYLRLQVSLGNYKQLTSALNSTIQNDADSLITRSILTGQTDGGYFKNVPLSAEGHLEVTLHDPTLPFGSVHAEGLTPVFQTDGVYGLNDGQLEYSSTLSGTVTAPDSLLTVKTGTTVFAQAQLQSRKRLRYRPGQGLVGRFAGYFDQGVADSYLVAGFGHAEDGVYFGYKDTQFGILYSERGVREVQTLTISTASTTNENVTVTLAGTAFSIAVTNSGVTNKTAYEISRGTYAGWKAYQIDSTVIFLADSAGNKTGTFSLTATTAVGTFSETKAGVAATETFIPQTEWNGDRLDGSTANNPSGYVIDPQKGNVYQIGIQYLGFGSITFQVEVTDNGGNNSHFTTVHTLKLPNTRTKTTFGNPSYPFTMAAYSAGSTTDIGVYVGSFGGFIEGPKILHGNRFTYSNTIATASTSYTALFTVLNKRVYKGRSNQSVVNLVNMGCAYKHNQPATFFLIKNGTLAGNPNFADYSTNSCTAFDTAGTTVTITNNDQILYAIPLSETGHADIDLAKTLDSGELTLQPGEWVSLCCRTFSGTATYAAGVLNTREDQ